MSSSKRRASDKAEEVEHDELLHAADITEEQMASLTAIMKEQDRANLIIQRDAEKAMQPIYAKRRPTLSAIDQFWFHAILEHGELAPFLQIKEDRDALEFLKDIEVVRDPKEFRAFTLEFHFKANPFFNDAVLKKEYKYVPQAGAEAGGMADADGITEAMMNFSWEDDIVAGETKINWKSDGVNLTKKFPRKIPTKDDMEKDDDDDDEGGLVEMYGSFFHFFEIAEDDQEWGDIFADDLYPEAIEYYLGKGPNSAEAWEDDSDEDSEDDDDDAAEIDLEKPKKKKGGK